MARFIDAYSFVLLIALALNFGLGLFIFFKNRFSEMNRSFAFLIFSVVAWIFSVFLLLNFNSSQALLWSRRFYTFSTSLILVFLLQFSLVFPGREKPLAKKVYFLIFTPGLLFALMSLFSPLMIKDFIINPDFSFMGKTVYGPAYYPFIAYVAIYFIGSFTHLIGKFFKTENHRLKLQIFYVLFGIGLTGGAGIATGLILPLLALPQSLIWGAPFSLIMAIFVSYAMLEYRLLDIEDFFSRGILFLSLSVGIIGTLAIIQLERISFLPFFYIALFNFAMASVVYLRDRQDPINVSFSIIMYIIAFWSFSIGGFFESSTVAALFFWSRCFYLMGTLIPSVLLYFSLVFPTEWPKLNKTLKFCLFIPTFVFIPIILNTNWIVKDFFLSEAGITATIGPAYIYFMLFFFVFAGLAFINLFRKYYKLNKNDKLRTRYVLWGAAIIAFTASVYNIILPWLGNYNFIWVGPYSTVIFSALISYAIVVHRLIAIENVVQRIFVYSLAAALVLVTYIFSVFFLQQQFGPGFSQSSLILTGLLAIAIAFAFNPLLHWLQDMTDRFFFRGRYDYHKSLQQISYNIASVIKLEELTTLIAGFFVETMKVSEVSFLLLDRDKEHFRSINLDLPRYKDIEIDVSSPIIAWLSASRDILVKEELEEEMYLQENQGREGEVRFLSLAEVHSEIEQLGIPIWVPIISKDKLIGIIALGHKLSGDIFTGEDLGLLNTLASQAAVALDNARLYKKVVNMKNYNEEILQSMVSGVMTLDLKGRLVTFNSMAEKITGRQAADVLGKTCEEVWGKRGVIPNIIKNTLEKNKSYLNFEGSIVVPQRGIVPVDFSSTILSDRSHKKIGVLLTLEDMTELKDLEGKVRRADKLAALATMAAGMAHEIKNPLSSMKVLSQLLPMKYDDKEYRKKLEEIMPREINRIDKIVESLLGFARATSLTFEKHDLNSILEEQVNYFEPKAKEADIKINKTYAEELPQLDVDKGQLAQVFSNLILNAIQAMPRGGELTIKTLPGKKVENLLQDVKVEIADTGLGISEDTVKKLFDPFFTTKYGGTGLGLTITHNIVEGHKGSIDVKSQVGQGTKFVVTLPVSQGLI